MATGKCTKATLYKKRSFSTGAGVSTSNASTGYAAYGDSVTLEEGGKMYITGDVTGGIDLTRYTGNLQIVIRPSGTTTTPTILGYYSTNIMGTSDWTCHTSYILETPGEWDLGWRMVPQSGCTMSIPSYNYLRAYFQCITTF